MNINTQIAIRIGGTKQRVGGFVPLVTMGVFPSGETDRMDSLPVIAESPAYMVRQTAEAILYRLTDRAVRAFDTETSGVLAIAIAIPKEAQLAGGKSPFSLLSEVYSLFRINCMAPTPDGRYSFLNQDIDDTPFRDLRDRYPLEDRPAGPYIQMDGIEVGILNVPSHHMEEFFKDTQYPEFRNYREIQLGASCTASPGLELLEIPRVTRYEVIENDTPTGRYLVKPEDRYESSMRDTDTVTYGKLAFTLQDLLAAPGNMLRTEDGSSASLDRVNSTIKCRISRSDIYYTVKTDLSDLSEECRQQLQLAYTGHRIKIYMDQRDITEILRGELKSKAREVLSARTLTMDPSTYASYRWKAELQTNKEEKTCLVKITAKFYEQQPAAAPYAKRSGTSSSPRTSPQAAEPSRPNPTHSPAPAPRNNGLDIKSMLIGIAAGLLVGAGLMFLLKPDKSEDTPETQSQLQELRNQHQKDSMQIVDNQLLFADKDTTIAKLQRENAALQNENNLLKTKQNGSSDKTKPANSEVTPEQEKDILAAINSGEKMAKIEKIPGYQNFIKKYSKSYPTFKFAVPWVVDYDSMLEKNDDGYFAGDKTKKHDPIIARNIKTLIVNKKGSGWTAQSIIECHQNILVLIAG